MITTNDTKFYHRHITVECNGEKLSLSFPKPLEGFDDPVTQIEEESIGKGFRFVHIRWNKELHRTEIEFSNCLMKFTLSTPLKYKMDYLTDYTYNPADPAHREPKENGGLWKVMYFKNNDNIRARLSEAWMTHQHDISIIEGMSNSAIDSLRSQHPTNYFYNKVV